MHIIIITVVKPLLRLFTLQGSFRSVVARAVILIAVIAFLDWWNAVNVYFGFLYVFPMLLFGSVFTSWRIALAAPCCTVLAEIFDPGA